MKIYKLHGNGMLGLMMKKDGINISYKAYTIVEGQNLATMAKSTALSILELSSIFEKLKVKF